MIKKISKNTFSNYLNIFKIKYDSNVNKIC